MLLGVKKQWVIYMILAVRRRALIKDGTNIAHICKKLNDQQTFQL
jgi:hypothetical protein